MKLKTWSIRAQYFLGTFVSLSLHMQWICTTCFAVSPSAQASNNELAQSFGAALNVKATLYSGYAAMQSTYENRLNAGVFTVHRLNGTELIKTMATDLEKMLKRKRLAVERLVQVAERHAAKYDWDKEPSDEYNNIQYINAPEPSNIEEDDYASLRKQMRFKNDARFERDVNKNTSIVQVPFNVYSKGTKLLKSVGWSKALNQQFKRNLELDPSIKWQYFGSTEGYIRVYPGFQWRMRAGPHDQLNIYDCRTRLWYTQSSTYPKDMIILLDRSGSMKGLKKSIAIDAVSALLDTLGDNDFFNVLTFSKKVIPVDPCYNSTLMRADRTNKENVLTRLRDMETSDIANFKLALRNTLDIIAEFHDRGDGSGCDCEIMLITDGAPDSYQYIFDQAHNSSIPQNHFRVFAYLVGQDKNYLEPVKDMACNNNGFFTQVKSPTGVTEQVLHHVNVMNRPLAYQGDHHVTWTKAYYDTTNGDEGFGLISTVASTVYKIVPGEPTAFLGIMATDVPISDMMNSMPINRIGVNAYVYMVTNNAYVMFHPWLETKYVGWGGKVKTKLDYNSIDIDKLEKDDGHNEVRSALVNRRTGKVPTKLHYTPLDNNMKSLLISSGVYYFVPVADTPFSLAMFLPSKYGHTKVNYSANLRSIRYDAIIDEVHCNEKQMRRNDWVEIDRIAAICSLRYSDVSVAETWRYCWFKNKQSIEEIGWLSQIDMLKLYLLSPNSQTIKCNQELVNGVLFDVYLTATLQSVWSEHKMHQNTSGKGIEMTFFISRSGVVRKYWHTDAQDAYKEDRNVVFRFDKLEYPLIYRRAVSQPKDSWLYVVPPTTRGNNKQVVFAAKAVRQREAIMGVSGLMLGYESFSSLFWDEVAQVYGVDCMDRTNKRFCYLVDDNAKIVLSKENQEVGRFFGEINGHVMNQLIEAKVFNRIVLTDETAMCQVKETKKNVGSAASNVRYNLPFFSVWSYFMWWTKELVVLLANVALYNWWTLAVVSQPVQANIRNQPNYRPCNQKYEVFVANRSKTPYTNRTWCKDNYAMLCEGEFGVFNVSNSNLFLIVTEQLWASDFERERCNCSGKSEPFSPIRGLEVEAAMEDTCWRAKMIKERKRPLTCLQAKEVTSVKEQPCTTEVKAPTNSGARLLPFWGGIAAKSSKSLRTFYSAWISCLTVHMVVIAVFSVICDGSLLRSPVL
ncbi:voltage-dependent calcium channel subunit alpha-2/delta-3-like isoform X2 [Ciona intestinalis]